MTLKTWLIAACATMALTNAPTLAQEETPPGATENHDTHHVADDDEKAGDETPDKSMMGHGGMTGGRDKDGMMRCPRMTDMMRGGHGKKHHGKMMLSRPMMEARLAFIKADLEITEAQMSQWDAYAEAFRARHEKMAAMHEEKMKDKGKSAPERVDARIESMETMLDGLKAIKGPTETLYAALSDEQKKKADRLLGARCGMM